MLLTNGVDPHWRDINGKTALDFAVKYNSVMCAKLVFVYSHYIESGVEVLEMSEEMRRVVRIGLSSHKFLNTFKTIDKKK